MGDANPQEHWRAACRALAEDRATAEARAAWHHAPIPFNHRWEHVQEVVSLALWLAVNTGADPSAVEAAAWLHDICKMQPQHAWAGAAEAEHVLADLDFPPAKIPIVVAAIRQHEGLYRPAGSEPLQPLEASVLWDADKLSKIGVQALAFSLSAPYTAGKTLAERRTYIEQFVRTVLAKTVRSMHTEPARCMAQMRYRAMVAALEAWAQEEEVQCVLYA
jgi:uncharacterized protein